MLGKNYISELAWEYLGIPLKELDEVAGEREVSLLRLLLPPPERMDELKLIDGWMDNNG